MSEQRHATVSAPVHLPVRTAAYDAVGSCTSVGCLYLASSFARRKTKHNQSSSNRTTGLPPLAHYVHIPVRPTKKKRSDYFAKEQTLISSLNQSLKVSRTPRFAEATTVCLPIKADKEGRSLFTDLLKTEKTQLFITETQPSDIFFSYINNLLQQPVKVPLTPASPLKSVIKVLETLEQKINNPLSLTFKKEQILKKHKEMTKKKQTKDLVRN
jgi:hypothetical protein